MYYHLPLNNLNAFTAAAEHLSFQEAAAVLHVTPSAVSHQIRNLEKILGYKLFDRLDKGVRLTAQGERLFADIKVPMKQLHEASRKAIRGLEDNSLTLSVAPVFATGWLLPRVKDFYVCHPHISLSIVATTELADFSSDPFDASIRMGTGEWQNTTTVRLFSKALVAVCHPGLIKSRKGLLTPTEISKYSLVLNSSMPEVWEEWFQSAGVEKPSRQAYRFQAQNSAQVLEAIQSGDSIGLVDRSFIQQDIESGRLSIASKHVLRGKDGYFLTYPGTAEDLPSLQSFKDWLCRQLTIDKEH